MLALRPLRRETAEFFAQIAREIGRVRRHSSGQSKQIAIYFVIGVSLSLALQILSEHFGYRSLGIIGIIVAGPISRAIAKKRGWR